MSDSWSLDSVASDTSWQLDPVGPPKKLGAGIKVGGADIGDPLTEQLGLNADSAALAAGSGRSHARLVAARKNRQDTVVANEANQQAQVDDLLRTDESYTPLGVAKAGAASIVRMAGSLPIGLQQGSEAANRMAHRFGDATIGKQFTDYWLAPADMVLGVAGDAPTKLQTKLNARGDAIDVGQSERDTVPYIVSNAVGQITGLIALNAVGGGGAADTAMLAQGFNQVADAFKAKGVTGAKADAAVLGGGAIMALLEKTGLESVLEGVPLTIKNRFVRGLTDVALVGGFNAAEETVQQIAGNYAQKIGGIKDQDLMEGVGQSAIGGGGAGGIARAVLGKWGKHVVAPPLAPDAANASEAPDLTVPLAPVETHAPLTEGDITSPIATPIIQQGRDMLKKGMEELQGIAGVTDAPAAFTLDPVAEAAPTNPNMAPDGRFQLSPRPAAAMPATRAAVKAKIRQIENSTGDPNARPKDKNGNFIGTASGRYQFTDGTWTRLGGDLANKNDPAEQERLMDKLTDLNAKQLSKAGIEGTPGAIYLAHFLGGGGAVNALRNPGAAVGEAVQKANPFARGWTNGQLAAWADKKMGGPGGVAGITDAPITEGDPSLSPVEESAADTIKRVTGTDIFAVGDQARVTTGDKTVDGIVEAVYGEGDKAGVRIKQADGTVFDEVLKDAADYGATVEKVALAAAAPAEAVAPPPAAAPPSLRISDRADTAVTSAGRSVPVRYAVIEAGDLIASNTRDGTTNPAYPADLQPRDRTRGVSQAQVAEIAGNLNPALLGPSPKASDGAPIVSPEGVVESGNGRTLAIQSVYDQGKGDAYRKFVEDQGFDTSGMTAPVLVRVRDGNMAPADVQAFTREANARDTLGYSATEQAMSDSAAMPTDLIDLYRGGDIDGAGNREFVRSFLKRVVSANDYAGMVAKDGTISQQAIVRVRAALLANAYGDANLVGQVAEATDSNIKALGGALTDIAGTWAKMVAAAKAGTIDPAMDITANVNEAVRIVDQARRDGNTVGDIIGQLDIFSGKTVDEKTEQVLRLMFSNPKFTKPTSRKAVGEALSYYVDQAMNAAPGGGLLGDEGKATPGAVLALAKGKQSGTAAEQGDLLAASSDGGSVRPASADGNGPAGESVQANDGSGAPQEGVASASFADAIRQTDPALDWDSSDRHERDAILRAIRMTQKADRLNTVDKPFSELPPALRAMVEAHLRQGYADKAGAPATAEAKPLSKMEARQVAIDAVREGRDTAGNTGDTIYSFGQKVVPTQPGTYMTPGKVHVERRGVVHTFNEADIRTAAKAVSTAPEHAAVGVDERELSEIVTEFNAAQSEMGSGDELVTHIFDAPAKNEIVRLNDKAKVYHSKHGWMTTTEARAKIEEWKAHAEKQGKTDRSANSNRIVLSLFDMTGAWSQPWEDAGYQVYRFDIQNDPEAGDVNKFSTDFFGDWFGDFDGLDIYAILAATPCTDFASSGARHFAAKDKDGRTVASVKLVHQTLATIEHFKPAVWALENPVGRIEKLGGLPPWRLSFDPNSLGDPYTKKTLLWGRFNGDLPVAPVEPTEGSKMFKQYGGKSLATKNARSVTPEGFSYGFFMANNAIDHPAMAIANKFDRLDRNVIERAVAAGVTEDQITSAVEDFYYQELDDTAADEAIAALIPSATSKASPAGVDAALDQGKAAFADGKNRVPPSFLFDAEHKKAWLKGWDQANLAAPVSDTGPVSPAGADEARIALEGGRKVNFVGRTYQVTDSDFGWTVEEKRDGESVLFRSGGTGMDPWSKTKAIEIAMDRMPFPKAQPTVAKVEKQADTILVEAAPHQKALGEWAKQFPTWSDPGLKDKERIVEKVTREDYPNASALKDIVRGGFFVSSKEEAATIAEAVGKQFKVVQDKGWVGLDTGYYDHKIIVDFGGGVRGEIQIVPKEIWDAKKAGLGDVYDSWRAMPDESAPKAQALQRQMIEGYAKAAAGGSFANDFAAAMSASGNSLTKSTWDSVRASFLASPGAAPQRPSLQDAPQAPLPSMNPLATGRASISANVQDATAASPSTAAVEAPPSVAQAPGYGAKNRLVSADRAAEIRNRLKAKLQANLASDTRGSFDPEVLALGTELAAFHIEAGARKFADFAKVVADDLGQSMTALKPYLRAWYVGAQAMIEDSGEDASGMDGPGAVRAAVAMIPDTATAPVDAIGGNEGTNNAGTATTEAAAPSDRAGNAGQEPANAPPAESVGAVGEGDRGSSGPSGKQLSDGARQGDGGLFEARPDASGNGDAGISGTKRGGTDRARPGNRVRDAGRGTNFLAPAGGLTREGSWKATAERNLDIIELVNKLEAKKRPATPIEQALLAKFTGWGASEIRNKLFQSVNRQTGEINAPYPGNDWASTINRAREVLKGDDLKTALQSTQYAHYTSEGVVRGMWDAMARLGFGGGRILEPGMGIGHFYTASPASVGEASSYTGIEFDAFSARIAKLLLPHENIIGGDFIKQALPDGFFDAAIGNPPFSATKITNDPAYKKYGFSLHDYFFAKSIDKIRPGGIMAFVTSRYTMDKLDPKARKYLADRADMVGAIRLPNTAFKGNAGTEVVTDVIFFQRRMPGAAPGGEAWTGTKAITAGGEKVQVNEYFAANPKMVLGKHATTGSMYSKNEYTVEPYAQGSLESQLAKAVQLLPADIYTEQPKANIAEAKAKAFERDFAPSSEKEGGLYLKAGKVLVVDRGSGVPVETIHKIKPADQPWLKDYVGLRDALKLAQKDQLQNGEWEKSHAALVKAYRAFVKIHGRIKEFTTYTRKAEEEASQGDDGAYQNKKGQWVVQAEREYRRFQNKNRLVADIESPLVESLESINDAGEIKDGPFLGGRTLNKPVRPDITSVNDALAVALDEIGRLDLDYVAKLGGMSRQDVIDQLGDGVFHAPDGNWQTADEYLSGDVLQKLEEAQAAAAADPAFDRNVKALEAVQPAPLSYDRIAVKLGAPWIRPDTVSTFAGDVLGFPDLPISYDGSTATWTVEGAKARYRRSNTADFGTGQRSAAELLDAILNNRTIKVMKPKDEEGKVKIDEEATASANEAAKKIIDRFKTWLWEDGTRAGEYVDIYNRAYNNIAPRRFNGDHLTLPGFTGRFTLYPHQKRAVWRIIQTGNTYLAHAVGAGKTYEMIAAGMEMRRLGMVKKPMYVVPNHMLNQFSQEFLEIYPAANVMVADEQAFHTGNRQRFLAQASLNDPDAIILTHSAFGKIDTSEESRAAVLNDLIAEMESSLEAAKEEGKANGGRSHRVSAIEKQIESLTKKFEGKTGTGKDKLLTFDQMGVDFLFVDEAHEFRKLDFATNRVAKGIDSAGSARSLDLFIKSRHLEKLNPGRSMVMASGTPVTNTMGELYTVMRFLALDSMDRDGIRAFDAWANMFGEVAPGYERNAAGGYEIVERFSKFVNVPELMKRVRNFMDVLVSADLGDLVKRPKVNGGGPQNIIAKSDGALSDYMEKDLNMRLETSRKWKPSKDEPGNPDPVINIITDARLASIDMRFVRNQRAPDPGSKLNMMIERIARIHKATAGAEYATKDGGKQVRKGSAQIVFSPVGLGEQVAEKRGFAVREWIDGELQRSGVAKAEIGWMSDANTHAKKEQLQKDVRSGKVRILVGSPKNMGTGLNVQDRLKALHFLAPPWFPADVVQPHGRIERQGNLNADVDIFWYATEGTYDSTGWGMVARKQKFIDDAMSGDDSVRTLEDISEANMFEMAAALAAGDDRVIRIAALGGEIERLERLKGAHANTQKELRREAQDLGSFEIPRLEKQIDGLKAANAARGTGYAPFSATVGKQTFTKQGEAGKAMLDAAGKIIATDIAPQRTEIGKLGAFPVYLTPYNKLGARFVFQMDVGGTSMQIGNQFDDVVDMDPVGFARRLEMAVQRIPADLQDAVRARDQAQRQLEAATKKVGAPFAEAADLADKVAERATLQGEIADETKAKQAAKEGPKASAIADGEDIKLPPAALAKVKANAADILRQLIPGDRVGLEFAGRLRSETGESSGTYFQRIVTLATDIASNKTWTMAHESVHAMKAMGLFTPTEWKLLSDRAWRNWGPDVTRRWKGRGLDEEGLREEAVSEEFAAYYNNMADLEAETGLPGTIARALVRMARFIQSVVRAVRAMRGDTQGVNAIDAARIMEDMRKGFVGSRPEGFGEAPRDRARRAGFDNPAVTFGKKKDSAIPNAIASGSPEFEPGTEERWQEARKGVGATGPGIIENAKAWWQDLTDGFTRHWRDLPNEPRFADVGQQFRKLEAAPDAAMSAALTHLTALVKNMSKSEYDLFSRKVVLDDLSWDAGEDRKLPFGFTPTTLAAARAEVDAHVSASPKLIEALRTRKTYNKRITDGMVETGVLTREQVKNPAYFRHMVLDYARHEAALARQPGKVRSPYWAKRMGTTMDINANFLEAEMDWLQKAQVDIATARTIEWIKQSSHNTRADLIAQAKAFNDERLQEAFKADPAALKEWNWFRSRVGMGMQAVADTIANGDLDPIPPQLQGAADALVSKIKDGDAPFALFAWMLDNNKPGAMGAGMALKYSGLRKEWERRTIGESYADTSDIESLVKRFAPDGVVAWQPVPGRHMFTAQTISESALDMFVGKLADTAYPGVDRDELQKALNSVRPQLVQGGDRYTMALPQEIAATLDEFGDRRGEGMVSRVFSRLQGTWKQWQLINPRRFLKYNINNMSGDLDAIIAGAPGSLRRVGEAWKLLRAGEGARYTEALERGVFTSGLSVQEIPDINRLDGMRHLMNDRGTVNKVTIGAVAKVWSALKDSTQFRENLFRLAAYLHYVDQVESGKDQAKIGYGASVPGIVDAVSDPKDRAALLARDLVGDYGSISVAGSWIRKYLVPFWSWTEINTRRYWRLTSNAYSQSAARGIATGGLLGAGIGARLAVTAAIRMGLVYGLLSLWNHLLWPDEEDKLGENQQKQLHIILGKDQDGQIMTLRLQGALSDVLNTVGLADGVAGLKKWQDGQGTLGQAAKDAMKAPFNKVGTSISPFYMTPLEVATGKKYWPDMTNPRMIHDQWRNLFSTVSLENEYDQAVDKPSRGYGRSWTESLIYRRDPGEMAYDDAKGIAYDWLERVKGQEGGSATSPRSEALRDYRLGVRYGDVSAANKALDRYEALGGTDKAFSTSLKHQHPLGPIAKKDRQEFLASLTDEQLTTFADAEDYYLRILAAPPK